MRLGEAEKLGFLNWEEMVVMISRLDISTEERLVAYMNWRETDCTKTGLIELALSELEDV